MSTFNGVKELPPDAIFFTKARFVADKAKVKYNLGIGAFRTKFGKPYVLDIVRKVQKDIANDTSLNKEYFPIGGNPEFIKNAQRLILGEGFMTALELRGYGLAGVQSLSGTGALRVLFEFISKNYSNATIWTSNPTWGNHTNIIRDAGLLEKKYTYFDKNTKGLNLNGMLDDLRKGSKRGDFVLLHACAHNPTGVDPTQKEWELIYDTIVNELGLIPFFDSAYQGFATGSLENDAFAVRYFADKGSEMLIAQSFSKNLGLYNERIGCASVLTKSREVAKAVNTQLQRIVRPMYSNPPSHGAYIVNRVLGNARNFKLWNDEMNRMSLQIIEGRRQLHLLLTKRYNTPGNWDHITKQIGMFCFSGLTPKMVERLELKHHVFMLNNGRISMAGVAPSDYQLKEDNDFSKVNYVSIDADNKTNGNVEYLAQAIDESVRFCSQSKL